MRTVPDEAVKLAKQFEGLSLKPYLCPAGIPTIGYGHVIPSLDHRPISGDEAVEMLLTDMTVAVRGALHCCPPLVYESDGRLAAIADFVFNLGVSRLKASTLRRKINEQNWPEASAELRKWVWGGGRKLPGLILRREAEIALLQVEPEDD